MSTEQTKFHHLDYEPPTGDSWCVECQIVFGTRAQAEAHTAEPFLWIDAPCGKCGPCRATYGRTTPTHPFAPVTHAGRLDAG